MSRHWVRRRDGMADYVDNTLSVTASYLGRVEALPGIGAVRKWHAVAWDGPRTTRTMHPDEASARAAVVERVEALDARKAAAERNPAGRGGLAGVAS